MRSGGEGTAGDASDVPENRAEERQNRLQLVTLCPDQSMCRLCFLNQGQLRIKNLSGEAKRVSFDPVA